MTKEVKKICGGKNNGEIFRDLHKNALKAHLALDRMGRVDCSGC